MVCKKQQTFLCEGGIEKSVTRDHRLSSVGKPRGANRCSSVHIFLSHPHTHDRFLYSLPNTSFYSTCKAAIYKLRDRISGHFEVFVQL